MAHIAYHQASLPSRSRSGGNFVKKTARYLSLLLSVAHERKQLARLDRNALKDMGLQRADVERELGRPFWDLPKYRID